MERDTVGIMILSEVSLSIFLQSAMNAEKELVGVPTKICDEVATSASTAASTNVIL